MTIELGSSVRLALIEELELFYGEVKALCEPLSEEQFWTKPIEPGNSIGHLVLHLTGNLNHFVGHHLGNTGYQRDREREFTETDVPTKTEALNELADTIQTFRRVVGGLTDEQLISDHPEERLGSVVKGLIHLVAHFALHRGQMSYLIRLVEA